MKKILAIATLCLMMAGMAMAAQQQEKAAQKPALKTHTGEVVSVDTTKNEIVIKQRTGKEMTCPLAADVKITKARKQVALADIKPGDQVTCRCDESGGKCSVKSISVRAAAQKKS